MTPQELAERALRLSSTDGCVVLVRETGPPGWLRVSVGTSAEMATFRAALTEVRELEQ